MKAGKIRVATTQFSLRAVSSPEEFWRRVEGLVKRAKESKADLIALPEYFSLSLLMKETNFPDFREALHHSQEHSQKIVATMQAMANQHQIAIQAGSLPWLEKSKLHNRCFVFFPNKKSIHQDKIFMTRFEKEVWKVEAGEPLVKTFSFLGRIFAVLCCYDSEFASLSQTLGKAGVEVLLVPSCTDTEHGYWRVRRCSEARTVENQLFVVMSSIVEGHLDFEEINAHHGCGGIFCPSDASFPANGILALGQPQQENICLGDLDFQELERVRKAGDVLNLQDLSSHSNPIPFSHCTP